MMVRRYESMEGEAYDDYARYQTRKSGGCVVNRYEAGRQSLQSLQSSVKAKRLIVFTNGDKPTKGDKFSKGDKYQVPPVQITFSKKKYPQLAPLCEEITRLTKRKVSRLFKWPSGREICNVSDIEVEEEPNFYVCSNEKALIQSIAYGGIKFGGSPFPEKHSRTSHDSRGTLRSEKASPNAARSHGSMNGGIKVPVNIEVSANTNRDSTYNLIIDTRSSQPFEKVLKTIEEMLEMYDRPISALYSKKKPRVKVDSYSSLNMALKTCGNSFWACGTDGPPPEINNGSRDKSPARNGNGQRLKYGNKQNGHADYRGRQSNDYGRQAETYEDSQGRSYQRHPQDQYEDDIDQDETDQEPSPPPAGQRGQRGSDQSPRRDYKQPTNRYANRRDEDDDESPQRDKRLAANRKYQRRDEDDDDDRRDVRRRTEQTDRSKQKRQHTPPRKDVNKRGRERNDADESNDESDGDDVAERRYHPSEAEMQKRAEEMERADSKLDKDVDY